MKMKKMVDNLLMYIDDFSNVARGFAGDVGPSSDVYEVKTFADFQNVVNCFSRVKFLELMFHGSPGMIYFPDNTCVNGAYLINFAKHPQFLQKDVRILFDGCSFGDGAYGDEIMDQIGSLGLQGKGGTLGASTITNVNLTMSVDMLMDPYDMVNQSKGRLKVRKYDVSGKLTRSLSVNRYGTVDKN